MIGKNMVGVVNFITLRHIFIKVSKPSNQHLNQKEVSSLLNSKYTIMYSSQNLEIFR